MRSGSESDSEWATPDWSVSGATTKTSSENSRAIFSSSARPGECTPSSLLRRMRIGVPEPFVSPLILSIEFSRVFRRRGGRFGGENRQNGESGGFAPSPSGDRLVGDRGRDEASRIGNILASEASRRGDLPLARATK